MLTLQHLVQTSSALPLSPADLRWLQMLRGQWQVIADLGAADLVLWLPTSDGRFVAAALCRSATATTLHVDDVIGLYASASRVKLLEEALDTGQIVDPDTVQWAGLYSARISYVPVVHEGRVIAVMSREANMSAADRQAGGQGWTLLAADVLCEMTAKGEFPDPDAPTSSAHGVPRVTDGTILLDQDGTVLEVSPNSNSAIRRLGISQNLLGRSLVEAVTNAMTQGERIEETLAVVLTGRAPWRVDVTLRGTTIVMHAIPLIRNGQRVGAVILTRDVTEMRRHEQQLMTKDATIREIHHRVKNNLQTVSALLRIQERRADSDQVREALKEAGRRVESIATVHEALAQNVQEIVDFDEVAPRILQMSAQIATTGSPVRLDVSGKFGEIDAEQASALATVLAELISNAVEHGTPATGGCISVEAHRGDQLLTVVVEDQGSDRDEGRGPKEPSDADNLDPAVTRRGLGTQIVQAMVSGELGGTITWQTKPCGGTRAELQFTPNSTAAEAKGAGNWEMPEGALAGA